ncbi:GIY-YIG nuclease family protein [Methylobacterium sp. CM6246]
MTARLPRVLRALLRGTPGDGILTLELHGSAIAMHAAPVWRFDELLELADVLAPGVYCLIGVGDDPSGKARALVGEGGMMRERLASHASDPRLDWVYEVLCWSGPRVMSDTVRLCLQRRLVDELLFAGRIGRLVGHDPERATASVYDTVAADGILEDMRMLAGFAIPGLMADVMPVRVPIAARNSTLPRGVDPQGMTWSTHEMAYAGARAMASMLARETVLLPHSTIIAATRGGAKWLCDKKAELLAGGVLVAHADPRLLLVTTFITFASAREATAFVAGGAAASASLTWVPVEP